MVDKKISELSSGGALAGTDEFAVARAGSTLKVTFDPSSKVSKAGDTMTGALGVPLIQFDPAGSVVDHAEGQAHWNPVDHTLDLHPDVTNATLQVGQENWLRVVNKTGVTLTDGQVVYVDDAQGNRPTVALADASATSTTACRTLGVVTADILNNAEGYVVTFGLLRGFNTSGFTDGDEVYVNSAVPGGITNVKPAAPAHCVRVGYALNSTNDGMLFISPLFAGDLPRQNAATKEPTGFESPELITESYDSTARTVTLTQTGGIPYWFRGVRYVLASPWTSAAHTATAGVWYLSFGSGGAFSWSQTPWTFDLGQVAFVNYDSPTGHTFCVGETHGLMPWQAHKELHEQIGTYRSSGGLLDPATYAVGGTATDARNTPGFDAAVVSDEDLSTTISAWAQGTYTHLYFNGTTAPLLTTGAALPFRVGGTNFPRFGSPTVAEADAITGRFLNVYQLLVPATSDAGSQSYRMIMVQPQASYTSLALAQAEDVRSLNLGTFVGTPEYVAFARITYGTGTNASYTGATGRCRIEAVAYLAGNRLSQVAVSGLTPSSHAALSDRDLADQHPAAAITFTPAGTITATNVQAAIEEASAINIGNCIIVRLATGDDATAQRGRLDLPFKTLEAAIAAATSVDEIKVFEQGTATTGTVGAIGVRIEMQAGAQLTIATGVTLFNEPAGGPQIYGSGRIVLSDTARLIVGEDVNLSLDVNSYTAGVNANGAYGIDLDGGIHHINIRSTLSQTNGAVGGAIRIQNSVVDIRIGGQVSAASSARTTPLIDLFACRGNLETGWNSVQPNANESPVYEVGLTGNFTIRGGQIFAGTATPFVRLKAGYTDDDNLNLVMYGVVSAGSGPVIEHKGGDWAVQVGITGPPGAGNAAIVADGTGVGAGLGISGYVSAGAGGDAIKAIPTDQVEITAKIYGDVAIADGSTIQMRGSTVVGTVKSISGTGTAKGVTPWAASTFPTAAVSGIVPTIDGGII